VNGKVYKGIFDCVVRMFKEEGPKSLFKGATPRVMWITLGGGIFFGTLEKGKELFGGGSV
jgi:hypothetical protein